LHDLGNDPAGTLADFLYDLKGPSLFMQQEQLQPQGHACLTPKIG